MANERIILGLNNRVDSATVTSSGNWSSTLPLSNVKSYILAKVATSTSTGTFTITVDMSGLRDRPIGCVGILNHNFSSTDTVQIQTYYNASSKDDSGTLSPFPFLASDDPVFDTYAYTPVIIDSQRRSEITPHLIYFLPTDKDANKVVITVTVASALSIGRIFVGSQFWPDVNVEYGGVDWGLQDFSEIVKTKSGVKYSYNYRPLREANVTYKWLTNGEATGGLWEAQRKAGLTGEVLIAPGVPTYTTIGGIKYVDSNWFSKAFIGNFSQLDRISNPYLNTDSTTLHIEEVAI